MAQQTKEQGAHAPVIWQPQPGPQALAIGAPFVTELLFGGARGGGKSDFLLGDFLQDAHLGSVWRGIIFRKSFPELEELITRAKEIFLPLGAEWKEAAKTFHFPGGATLKMRYIERLADADNYQGHQYTWIGWDELTNWADMRAYKKLKACLRSAHGVKNKRIRCSANPGGVGHHEVKAYFIDKAPKGLVILESQPDESGNRTTRMFVPSKVQDNKILMDNDPEYISRLREVGTAEMVKAWLEGDWNVITGAFFPEFNIGKHVIEPFPVPANWMRFRSMDWGSATPFSVGWWAVSDGFEHRSGLWIPRGAMVRYREWYGASAPNVGLRLTANKVAKGIAEREKNDPKLSYGVCDPSMYKRDGGPSIAERMADEKIFFRKGDNHRIPGWDQVRDRLVGNDDIPMLYFFDTCEDSIRTLPALQHDEDNMEDCDSDGEDHGPDDIRYACMSRPFTRVKAGRNRGMKEALEEMRRRPTLQELFEDNENAAGLGPQYEQL